MHRPPRSQLARPLAVAAALAALTPAAGPPAAASPGSVPHGLDLAGIDRAAAPGEDFFRYANGNWLKATEIPPDRSSYGTSAMLAELTTQRTVDLIRAAADGAAAGSEAAKIGDYYASFMDEAAIESKGFRPLEPALRSIDSIADRAGLARALGATLRADVDVLNNTSLHTDNFLGLWVAQDLDDPSRYAPFLLQGGLGMPDRDYYLGESAKMAEVRSRYQAHFAFHEQTLSGTPQLRPRWKRAVDETNAALGEAVGKLYVQRYFPPSEKARAEGLVRNLVRAFAARIDRLEWMTPGTRQKAKAKLNTLKVGVGYPDKWRDYSGLEVIRGDALGNARRAELFELHYNLAKLAQPVDRSEWCMTPQTVNAVNLPAMNALNFPAAMLQPPYFDPERDPVMDYGATGAVIGHEISHSFDDQGALFDADGRLLNWWTPSDFAHFRAAGDRLVAQFDAYRPLPDIHVNGRQTLSENIADVAGLSVAYDAWRLTQKDKPAPAAAGFTPEQLFFISFGQSWRQKIREPALRQRIVVDGHAPAEYRADTVRNLDPWYAAFGVKPGQKIYLAPAERVRVW